MQSNLMEKLKGNKVTHSVGRFIKMNFCKFIAELGKKIHVSSVSEIEKLKMKYDGERCFIICTGPSLTIDDLELLKKEHTFSMNSIISMFDKSDFRPEFYMLQDGTVEKKIRSKLQKVSKDDLKTVFLGEGNVLLNESSLSSKVIKTYSHLNPVKYNFDWAYHFFDMYYGTEPAKVEFSEDCAKTIKDGFTVTYSAIQLAIYMGFKEIYLLGCDTSTGGHFDKKIGHNTEVKAVWYFAMAYEVAKEYAEKKSVRIYNATRGGMLETFPRVDLNEVLKNE